ncbi:nucleotidyltransferase [bacterium]|nr:nucleotidyltransferase [bacterium]
MYEEFFMNIIGLVAEYNPFHNGHKYQIETIKKMYPDSVIIVVLSSSFTQRGEISVLDKWEKTDIALNNKIDLVVELPYVFSTESADTFAHASIKMLNELKIDTLVFGSESDDTDLFFKLAKAQIENKEFDDLVNKYFKEGNNYPTALSKALKEITNEEIDKPNDLLAISYTKEILKINKKINIVSIKRTNNFHDISGTSKIVSASNIRNKMYNGKKIKKYVPKDTYLYLKNKKVNYNKMYELLKYKINDSNDLSIFQTVDEGIENRITDKINNTNSVEELIKEIKTKRYTYNKISRMLSHILIGFTKNDKKKFKEPSYIRILGMSEEGKKHLNRIKKETKLPIISKFKTDEEILQFELKVTKIYSQIVDNPSLIEKEYKNNIIKK